jgi:hypothetical protein
MVRPYTGRSLLRLRHSAEEKNTRVELGFDCDAGHELENPDEYLYENKRDVKHVLESVARMLQPSACERRASIIIAWFYRGIGGHACCPYPLRIVM